MLILDGRALSFAESRAIERAHVEAATAEGDPDRYMRQVAEKVADQVRYLSDPIAWLWDLPATTAVTRLGEGLGIDEAAAHIEDMDACLVAFVGGGDNGGDALYACAMMAERGKVVTAFLLKPTCHARALETAREAGVGIVELSGRSLRSLEGTPEWNTICGARVWIDGIVGIGAQGPLTGELAETVTCLNEELRAHPKKVIAIDVPSGLTDDDGHVAGPILRATHTLAVGVYKRAQILPPAVEYCGQLRMIGMYWSGAHTDTTPDAEGRIGAGDLYYYDSDERAAAAVPTPAFADDKYARGVVGLVAGSDTYPGAGLLATRGALASGVGMVRLNSTRRVQDLVLAAEPGVVMVGGRIQAALIGPGMDEDRREDALELAHFCGQSGTPLVIDAGALDLVPELLGTIVPDATVLTPHYGEAARLLSELGKPTTRAQVAAAPLRYARALHEATGAHVVLKGPVTIVYSFEDVDLTHGEGADDENAPYSDDARSSARADLTRVYEPTVARVTTSWAGVAGSGDVLAGLIAGILARPTAHNPASTPEGARPLLVTSARLSAAVSLHASAAQTAAIRREGRAPIQARDIADAIPEVLAALSL
ncbi:bifunctional ADP-dependent NAD(P)H-hydrate dehydratase/NAD(P)H-hydrate epimerase [uncultured Actinomyces sp.]|uniref:bifunctional ADP-dependent NAD(P)H-hydrate dehydratase/NAD(P)H-hydrate epimerase n=1 Tax=uncultured Actinomyces sp. TaxID=249061 RepID=UPI002673E90F|nr:bifunctional ADP-dependent NAD(P)H-hydrate dehydratase/NAD(P)H-hydrate epimerase [uncultured Actinomyces sp.]